MGGITQWLYDDMALGGVMMLAMVLNLLVASMMGVIIPDDDQTGARPRGGVERDDYRHHRYRRFLYFLGLATIFLL